MFDEIQRELRRLAQTTELKVALPSDEEGYVDRVCPSKGCSAPFKVYGDDWRDKVRDEQVFCPFCRHIAPAADWFSDEQRKHARELAIAQIKQRINGALQRDAQSWNRRQRKNEFISITMHLKNAAAPLILPLAIAEPMRLKIACPECQCRYAVIGAAFFCPACGHNAADLVFDHSLTAIQNTLNALTAVRAAITDRDAAETTVRHLLEGSLQNIVTTFQRYAEVLYSRLAPATPPRRNAFQNLNEGSELWFGATGRRYDDFVSTAELKTLVLCFQQRHLLAHTQGLIDSDYISRSGDSTYQVGQRVVVREQALREYIGLVEKLARAMSKQ